MHTRQITLATFVKNEEDALPRMLSSIEDYVHEIIVVDTGSTDSTPKIAKCFTDYVYQKDFTNFGDIRNFTSHLATKPWVLMLDADETLTNPDKLIELIALGKEAYAFPRRRWLDLEMKNRTELEAYPDLQVRFYRNNKDYVWKRELHEYFDGAPVETILDGPIIEHFQDVYKDSDKIKIRDKLYTELAAKAGVHVVGGKPL